MDVINLQADAREVVGKQVSGLRREGQIPAVIYGAGAEPQNISLESRLFDKVYAQAGDSSLIDLSVGGSKSLKVLVQEVQRDPIKGQVIHVDFRQVKMDEELETEISLSLVGEAPAVKEKGGILLRSMDTVWVRCLPGALVHEIEVDLSGLNEIDDNIKIGDITPPEGIIFMSGPEEVIAVVNAPISEEELEELESKPEEDVEKVEVAGEEEEGEKTEVAEKEPASAE
jgi:large subunit ribosomal protein L25